MSKRCIHPKKKSRDDQVGTRVQQKNNVTAHGFFEKPCHHYLHRYILRRRITSVFNHSFEHKLFGLEDSLMAVEIWLVVVAFKPFNRLMAQPAFLDVTTKVPVDHAGLNRCLFTPFRSESESGSLFHVWFDDSKLEMLRINAITIVERS